jgi:hypothetical protein
VKILESLNLDEITSEKLAEAEKLPDKKKATEAENKPEILKPLPSANIGEKANCKECDK